MKNKEEKNITQIINIKDNSVLIFKIKGIISKENYIELRNRIEEQTKCKCLLLSEDIDLISVLNIEKNTPIKISN